MASNNRNLGPDPGKLKQANMAAFAEAVSPLTIWLCGSFGFSDAAVDADSTGSVFRKVYSSEHRAVEIVWDSFRFEVDFVLRRGSSVVLGCELRGGRELQARRETISEVVAMLETELRAALEDHSTE